MTHDATETRPEWDFKTPFAIADWIDRQHIRINQIDRILEHDGMGTITKNAVVLHAKDEKSGEIPLHLFEHEIIFGRPTSTALVTLRHDLGCRLNAIRIFNHENEKELREYERLRRKFEPKDNWIEWKGGECPVDPDCMVEVKFTHGEMNNKQRAGFWTWGHSGVPGDIVAYRITA